MAKEVEVYCLKCRKKSKTEDYEIKNLKNGRKMAIAKCKCGGTGRTFLPKDF